MKSLTKGLRLRQVEEAAERYELMKRVYEHRIYPNVEGLRNTIRLLGSGNEKIRKVKAEEVVNDRFVRRLEKDGLF